MSNFNTHTIIANTGRAIFNNSYECIVTKEVTSNDGESHFESRSNCAEPHIQAIISHSSQHEYLTPLLNKIIKTIFSNPEGPPARRLPQSSDVQLDNFIGWHLLSPGNLKITSIMPLRNLLSLIRMCYPNWNVKIHATQSNVLIQWFLRTPESFGFVITRR